MQLYFEVCARLNLESIAIIENTKPVNCAVLDLTSPNRNHAEGACRTWRILARREKISVEHIGKYKDKDI